MIDTALLLYYNESNHKLPFAKGDSSMLFSSLITALLLSLLLVRWGIRYFVFRKAGEEGWKSFIPFFGAYTSYKIVWEGKIYWALLIAMGGGLTISLPFFLLDSDLGFVISLMINTVTFGAYFLCEVMRKFKMSRSFGMQDKHFVGLCLLNNIFSCIAAFGEYEYQGVQYKDGIGVPEVLVNMGKKPAPAQHRGYEYQPPQQSRQSYDYPPQADYQQQEAYRPQEEYKPQEECQAPVQPVSRRSDRNNSSYGQY